jgi:2,4-dienoyl-CoA reductase (NADPH2)
MAKTIPGKEEFIGLVDWFATMLDRRGIDLRLGRRPPS